MVLEDASTRKGDDSATSAFPLLIFFNWLITVLYSLSASLSNPGF